MEADFKCPDVQESFGGDAWPSRNKAPMRNCCQVGDPCLCDFVCCCGRSRCRSCSLTERIYVPGRRSVLLHYPFLAGLTSLFTPYHSTFWMIPCSRVRPLSFVLPIMARDKLDSFGFTLTHNEYSFQSHVRPN